MQKIICGDALSVLRSFPESYFHLVVTDPPYFVDGFDDSWDEEKIQKRSKKAGVIGSLPVGMKFDSKQGKNLYRFLLPIFFECLRVLRPGGFLLSFSQGRLYHSMTQAAEDAGFEIRDMLGWTYYGQPKAFSPKHFIKKDKKLSQEQKDSIIQKIGNRKSPQLAPMIEPICLAQKRRDGTMIDNFLRFGTGLINVDDGGGKFPGVLFDFKKPSRTEKGDGNNHPTVKPVNLIRRLLKIFSNPGDSILDPFLGSGSTLLACALENRIGVGIEKNFDYVKIAENRLQKISDCLQVAHDDLAR
jgi:site-specific DNA-methyltransferase (adenine-specific)